MPRIYGAEKLLSDKPHNRLGRFRMYGRGRYGDSRYGDDEIYVTIRKNNQVQISGIYHRNHAAGDEVYQRLPYYFPRDPKSDPQKAQRQKMTDSVIAWHNLTSSEKEVYNERAKGKNLFGFNLFLSEYMKTL